MKHYYMNPKSRELSPEFGELVDEYNAAVDKGDPMEVNRILRRAKALASILKEQTNCHTHCS